MPKGFKGFQKGHPSFISPETYKTIGQKNSDKLKILFKGKTLNTGRTHFKNGHGMNKGSENPQWRGGRFKSNQGYIHIKAWPHPFHNIQGYVLEHRLVMEKNIGRFLKEEEIVHHINGIKDDNRIENLQIIDRASHATLHCKGKKIPGFGKNRKRFPKPCKTCGKMIQRLKRPKTAFCSQSCASKSFRKHQPRPCKICGKIIEKPKKATTSFCSFSCSAVFKNKMRAKNQE